MERKLPLINLLGTDFIVDVEKMQLREKANPNNIIAFGDMKEGSDGYSFEYSPLTKNIPSDVSKHYIMVKIPEFVKLDPEGMANKYKVPDISGKTDFEVIVNQQSFARRVRDGVLPTVEILGYTFYVDLRMDKLRPHDDFGSRGIIFAEIDHHFSDELRAYVIPYNPKTHEFQELDFDSITAYPKDLFVVKFPFQQELDPVGWNRLGGWDLKDGLKQIGLKSHFKAEVIPWSKTSLKEVIKVNLAAQKKQSRHIKHDTPSIPPKPPKGKGRKM